MHSGRRVLVWLGLLLILAAAVPCALGQTSDGPYFVVDAAIAEASGQVFPTIAGALATIAKLGPQGWGATLMINPGVYPQSPGLVVAVRGLTIMSRDGPEKTQIVPEAGFPGTPLITVAAPYVTLRGLKLAGTSTRVAQGITVAADDCTLVDLVLTGLTSATATAGVIATPGADRLSIVNARISGSLGGGAGISIGAGSRNVRISQSEIRGGAGSGIALVGCTGGEISGNQVVGNNANGITAATCEGLVIKQNVISGNVTAIALGPSSLLCEISANSLKDNTTGIAVTDSMRSLITGNDLSGNDGGGITDTGTGTGTPALGSVGNQILTNLIAAQQGNGVAGGWVGAAPGIALTGKVSADRVEGNTLAGNGVGIALATVLPWSPAGCTVLTNTISRSSTHGIHIAGTNGGNVFANNTISDSNQAGILIAAAPPAANPSDVFRLNSTTGDGQAGIRVTAPGPTGPVVILESNTVSLSGGSGIEVAPNTFATLPVAIINSVVRECGGHGITVSAESPALRLEGNELADNRLNGLNVTVGPVVCAIYGNNIHGNHGVGVALTTSAKSAVTSSHNAIWANRQGGVQLAGPTARVLDLSDNDIFGNLGYGLSCTWPLGFGAPSQAGANWWGATTGPSGLFAGAGNAILGLTAGASIAAAPILPAPVASGPGKDAVTILDAAKSQFALIPSFAAQKVIVNRLDTACLRLVFSGVSDKDFAWVNTAPFTKQALQMPTFSGLGQVVSAAAVLVAGVSDGNVEIGFGFDPSVLPAGTDLGKLRIYLYLDGAWKASSRGDWTLEGGAWQAIGTCSVSGGEIVIGSTAVADLTGRTKAIALVLEP